jgi:hypothetical protein
MASLEDILNYDLVHQPGVSTQCCGANRPWRRSDLLRWLATIGWSGVLVVMLHDGTNAVRLSFAEPCEHNLDPTCTPTLTNACTSTLPELPIFFVQRLSQILHTSLEPIQPQFSQSSGFLLGRPQSSCTVSLSEAVLWYCLALSRSISSLILTARTLYLQRTSDSCCRA